MRMALWENAGKYLLVNQKMALENGICDEEQLEK